MTTFTVESLQGSVVEMFAMDSTPAAIVHLSAEDEIDAAKKAWDKVLEIGTAVLSADYETKTEAAKLEAAKEET